jgi:ribosomal protein L40E
MPAKRKKSIMIVIIVLCLVLAVVIMYKKEADYKEETYHPTGIETIDPNNMIWVKCTSADCQAEYQMGMKDYFQYLNHHLPSPGEFAAMLQDPNKNPTPALPCTKCEAESIYRAEKCESCGIVFLRGTFKQDFADRCTGCNYSKTEDQRKKARQTTEQPEQ